jgi:hypothetical protein
MNLVIMQFSPDFCDVIPIALGYELDIGVLGFDSRRGLGIFLFTTGSGAHPASYPMDTRSSFPGGRTTGA